MSPVAKRKPLTDTQREVFTRLAKLSGDSFAWVPLEQIGSRTACENLAHKGFADALVERGPRGGKNRFYRPAKPIAS